MYIGFKNNIGILHLITSKGMVNDTQPGPVAKKATPIRPFATGPG